MQYIRELAAALEKIGFKKESVFLKKIAQGYDDLPGGLELSDERRYEYPDEDALYETDSAYHEHDEYDYESQLYEEYDEGSYGHVPFFDIYRMVDGEPKISFVSASMAEVHDYFEFASYESEKVRSRGDEPRLQEGFVTYRADGASYSAGKKLFNYTNEYKGDPEISNIPGGATIETLRSGVGDVYQIRGVGEFSNMNDLLDFSSEEFLKSLIPESYKEEHVPTRSTPTLPGVPDEYVPDYEREEPIGKDIDRAVGYSAESELD